MPAPAKEILGTCINQGISSEIVKAAFSGGGEGRRGWNKGRGEGSGGWGGPRRRWSLDAVIRPHPNPCLWSMRPQLRPLWKAQTSAYNLAIFILMPNPTSETIDANLSSPV